jgi:hypothetical protein
MATRQYNMARGDNRDTTITEATGSSVSSGFVQVTVDLAQGATKRDVTKALERLTDHIERAKWPPA